MKTVHKVLISILSVLLVLSVAALGLSFFADKVKDSNIQLVPDGADKGEAFENICTGSLETEYPLVQSDIDNIFYCLKPDGSVEFYELTNKAFAKYSGEVKSVELNPSLTYYKIPITVHYIEVEGKTIGYGLFTTQNSDAKVNLYSYVFAKLTDASAIYSIDGKMLLLSTNSDEAYSLDKTYTEVFDVDMDAKKCTAITAQRDRNADRTGRLSERWSMFTDGFLASVSKKAGMISGRRYSENTLLYDVYNLNGSLNKPEVEGIYGTFLREDADSGFVYIKKTVDGFKSVQFAAEEKTVAEFIGDINKDFVFSSDWVFDKNQKLFTNLVTGKTVDGKGLDGDVIDFCTNDDGSKIAAVVSAPNGRALRVVTADGKVSQYEGTNVFCPDFSNMCFADSSTVITSAVASDGVCTNYIISAQ